MEEKNNVDEEKKEVVEGEKSEISPKNKNWLIFIVLGFLLIIVAVGFLLLKPDKSNNKENSENNSVENTENNENKENIETPENTEIITEPGQETNNKKVLDEETINELEKIKTDLKEYFNNGYKAYNVKCTDYGDENGPNLSYEYIEVSNDSIDIIIDKLKTAKEVEKNVTTGYIGNCSPRNISYTINLNESLDGNKKFIVMYGGDDSTTLDIGYNSVGYRYYFNSPSDIENLLENLSQ